MTDIQQPLSQTIGQSRSGLYLHVPFCARSCDFCAFYQIVPQRDDIRRYLKNLDREVALCGSRKAATCFVGGGTPSVLHERDLDYLGRLLLGAFGGEFIEWTVEVAPGSVRLDMLRRLKDLGVTRISMGVQSFRPELLEALGRPHDRKQIYRAYDWIREIGFASVNLDLIFAVPGQDAVLWHSDLESAIRLETDHLSTYCLTFEEDTALYVRLSEGKIERNEAVERDLYLDTWETLQAAGFEHYEISNFARTGHQCIHNMNTWKMGDWVGLGPAAASQQDGWRGGNPPDLEAWIGDLADGHRGQSEREELSPGRMAEDSIVFGLRLIEGVDLWALERRFPGVSLERVHPFMKRLEDEGLLVSDGRGKVRLTESGLLISDAIGADLMGLVRDKDQVSAGDMNVI
jgi:oxygen-independent coproporphyrinogen-3 oxidase